jgi:hypothetical protein
LLQYAKQQTLGDAALLGHSVYLRQGVDILPDRVNFRQFDRNESIQYYRLCDDFGQMILSSSAQFIQLDGELRRTLRVCFFTLSSWASDPSPTGAFLLGALMILHLKASITEVKQSFS